MLSLELCGIGDSLAIWDAAERDAVSRRACARVRGRSGCARDEGYHVVGRIPVFGSDHRAFAAAGSPAYGLSAVPARAGAGATAVRLRPLAAADAARAAPAAVRHVSHPARQRGHVDPAALDLIGARWRPWSPRWSRSSSVTLGLCSAYARRRDISASPLRVALVNGYLASLRSAAQRWASCSDGTGDRGTADVAKSH